MDIKLVAMWGAVLYLCIGVIGVIFFRKTLNGDFDDDLCEESKKENEKLSKRVFLGEIGDPGMTTKLEITIILFWLPALLSTFIKGGKDD